ncbi:CPN protein [Candidatus Rhodobacter oscarellae]|uniref:CPN protein n=1 Tax=Candidatus Rhodobacter oscarellae TaxID=1675527 RepID=A0A0J9EDE9_9RHOB|nr:hypothetical protein [Candidatus Rhodobacter lobularis]KMW60735.1 CPN protein [Candidatus Rhodobacter lobularis]
MVNASKILTVSYGTFSCTLEGFDDPFSTMRSIAEYFRDLAADDRYFGAEPPVPDPEMLHKIAERDIQRRVEARVGDNTVVLRQLEGEGAASAPDAPAPASEAPVADPEPAVAAPPPAAQIDTPEVTDAPAEPESVAAKLARIRAAVAHSRVETEPLMNEMFAEDEGTASAPAAVEPIAEAVEPIAETVQETPVAEPETEGEDEDALSQAEPLSFDAETAAEAETEEEQDDAPAVSDAAEETDEISAFVADEAEDAADPTIEEEAEAELSETAEALQVEADEAAADIEDAPIESGEFDSGEIAALVTEDEPQAVAEADEDESSLGSLEHPEDDADDETGSAAEKVADAISAAALTDAPAIDETDEANAADDDIEIGSILGAAGLSDSADDDADEADQEDSADDDQAMSAPRVRVMKMSREEFERSFEEDVDDDEAPQADTIRESLGETGLSSDDEDDLIRELMEVNLDGQPAEASPTSDETQDETLLTLGDAEEVTPELDDEPGGDGEVDSVARDLANLVAETEQMDAPDAAPAAQVPAETDDASVDRLLAKTDDRMDDNDGSQRRSAIAHLKAAVAAVRADGDKARETEEAENARTIDQFRDDLARVVRPSRPERQVEDEAIEDAEMVEVAEDKPSRAARPTRRMPPLMLVSEQRIDKDDDAENPAAPVRPRRVQADDLEQENEIFASDGSKDNASDAGNIFSNADDFKTYVAETGAEGTQEVLEASLAFGLFVEGAQFNARPQIMRRMLSLYPDGSVTREDGLRAFGVLLREGRIQRLRRREFVLPETSRFHPGAQPEANSA